MPGLNEDFYIIKSSRRVGHRMVAGSEGRRVGVHIDNDSIDAYSFTDNMYWERDFCAIFRVMMKNMAGVLICERL